MNLHATNKDGKTYLKKENPYPKTTGKFSSIMNPDWVNFERDNPPIECIGFTLPDGAIIDSDRVEIVDAVKKPDGTYEIYDVKPLFGIRELGWIDIKVYRLKPHVPILKKGDIVVLDDEFSNSSKVKLIRIGKMYSLVEDLETGKRHEVTTFRLSPLKPYPQINAEGEGNDKTLEQAALESAEDLGGDALAYFLTGFKQGALWQSQQSDKWIRVENVVKIINDRIEALDMRIDTMWELEELRDKIKSLPTPPQQ